MITIFGMQGHSKDGLVVFLNAKERGKKNKSLNIISISKGAC